MILHLHKYSEIIKIKIITTLKFVFRVFVHLLTGILVYLFSAIVSTLIPINSAYKESKDGVEIFISTNGVHTNIILPAKTNSFNWNKYLSLKEAYKYLAFGWGDKEFYLNTPTWGDLKFSTAFKAAFLPTQTIMQVYGYNQKPQEGKRIIKLILNENQFEKISIYVSESFKQNDTNQIIEINPNNKYSFKEKFYPANGTYTILNTCNNWVNKGLKQAEVKTALWAPFDKSVMYHLRK